MKEDVLSYCKVFILDTSAQEVKGLVNHLSLQVSEFHSQKL